MRLLVLNGDERNYHPIYLRNLLHNHGIDNPLMINDAPMNDGDCIVVSDGNQLVVIRGSIYHSKRYSTNALPSDA